MFMDLAQSLTATTLVAFVLGWLVAKGAAYIGNRISAAEQDPRDSRIRTLDAELRIAKNEGEKRAEDLSVEEFVMLARCLD